MRAIIARDLLAGRKEDYNTAAGLCFLFERGGGKVTPAMEAAVLAQERLLDNPLLLQLHAYFDSFVETLPVLPGPKRAPAKRAAAAAPGAKVRPAATLTSKVSAAGSSAPPGNTGAARGGAAGGKVGSRGIRDSPEPTMSTDASSISATSRTPGHSGSRKLSQQHQSSPPAKLNQQPSAFQLLPRTRSRAQVQPFPSRSPGAGGASPARPPLATSSAASLSAVEPRVSPRPTLPRIPVALAVMVRLFMRMRRLKKAAALSAEAEAARADARCLTHLAFYEAFMARHISSFTSPAAKCALGLLDVDGDGVSGAGSGMSCATTRPSPPAQDAAGCSNASGLLICWHAGS
jgi:hypothetical protein